MSQTQMNPHIKQSATSPARTTKNLAGFTLLELMIVVLIIGVLSGIATSYFGDNVQKSRRTDARTTLLSTASTLEKCKAIYGTFNNANCSIASGASIDSAEGYYSIAATSAATTFSLTASPVSGKSQEKDTDCKTISVNNLGEQTATGDDPTTCW